MWCANASTMLEASRPPGGGDGIRCVRGLTIRVMLAEDRQRRARAREPRPGRSAARRRETRDRERRQVYRRGESPGEGGRDLPGPGAEQDAVAVEAGRVDEARQGAGTDDRQAVGSAG